MLPELDKLCPTMQIRLQPGQYRPRHAELRLQPLHQCRMAHGVEGCGQVEADEYCHLLVVGSSETLSRTSSNAVSVECPCLYADCCPLKFLELVRWDRRRASTSLSSTLETVERFDIGL